jgi:large subunit ribosomal protein L4
MKATKYDQTGAKQGEVELPSAVFSEEVKKGALYTVLRTELRNRRQGTHKTKMFGEVSGGGKKPYRQKGTGNARQGSIRAPQYRKGGIVFGPQPRDYRLDINVKLRKVGLKAILSRKAKEKAVHVLADVRPKDYSTKAYYNIFKKMGILPGDTIAYVVDSEDQVIKKSTMNIPQIALININRLTAPELIYSTAVIFEEAALKKLEAVLSIEKTKGAVA